MELSQRQKAILKAVVEDYVLTAVPVASERIAGAHGLKVSSATVRNEMMELEELGLLTHPHTSSGRVPSDLGYRFYTDHLMPETALAAVEQQTIWHQFHQVEAEVDEWGPLAAAVLAQMARTAALATRLYARQDRIKRLELVSVQEDLALVVLILRSGGIRQRLMRLNQSVERDELIRVANKLSAVLEGKTAFEAGLAASRFTGLEREMGLAAARLMEQSERRWSDSLFYEGIGFVSVEPEFGRTERLVNLMEALQRGLLLEPLLADALASGSLKVVIGSENEAEEMRSFSVILKRYGLSDQAAGVVGLVGPTRMRYWRAVSLVRFMADLLDRLVMESLG